MSEESIQGNEVPEFTPPVSFSEDGKSATIRLSDDDVRTVPAEKVTDYFQKGLGYDKTTAKHAEERKAWATKEQQLGAYKNILGEDVLGALGKMSESDANAAVKRMQDALRGKPAAAVEDDPFAWLKPETETRPEPGMTKEEVESFYKTQREQERRADEHESQMTKALDELGVPDYFRGKLRTVAYEAAVNNFDPEKKLDDYVKDCVSEAERAVDEIRAKRDAAKKAANANADPNISRMGVPGNVKGGDALKTAKLGSPEWRKAANAYADALINR